MKTIELLAPAKDVATGVEAILHGADAVYIGGPSFGARSAAGNTVEDIARLSETAHLYGAKVYVTLNTILTDTELDAAVRLVRELYRIGVDALIVQDLALLESDLPPIALHASTQMDNTTPEKAAFLEAAGFRQIVIARETSLEMTRRIAETVKVPLEAFVHGALCVSYSGRCYASEFCFGRSANRGRCAQFCRLPFDLTDANGKTLVSDSHLLSLRDMNRTDDLEAMMDAGIRSFKIEGRLKDTAYVKNVTAWYRRAIDEILARRNEDYRRASYGTSRLTFTPDAARSFNRGFTDYFLRGRTDRPVWSFHTPKAIGAEVGRVERVNGRSFSFCPVPGLSSPVTAGDGLCFLSTEGHYEGFRVNRAEGGVVYLSSPVAGLKIGTVLHRSADFALEKQLTRPSAVRTLSARLTLRETATGYALDMEDESGLSVTETFTAEKETARTPQEEAQRRTLSKLGDTPFQAIQVEIDTAGPRFIPASVLTAWRRAVVEALLRCHRLAYHADRPGKRDDRRIAALLPETIDYTGNVANERARRFYLRHGVKFVEPAFELDPPKGGTVLMTCRHCIRFALGICLKKGGAKVAEPLSLRSRDGRVFPLQFDCRRCEMRVLLPQS